MIRLKSLISKPLLENLNEINDVPPAQIQHSSQISGDFVNYVKKSENGNKHKYINGRWFPYKDPNGEFYVIAYGHKLSDSELKRCSNGISDSEANKMLMQDLEDAKKKVYDDIYKMFKVKVPLDSKREEMLIDLAFNLGSIRGFPKFVKAVLNNDIETMKQEYKRKWKTPSGQTKELTGRNVAFFDRFFK